MTRKTRRIYLAGIAIFSILMALLFLAIPSLRRNPGSPDEVTAMARWLGGHPADWVMAGAFSGNVLDSTLPRRVELWRTAHELSQHLAPRRQNPAVAFVRGGLFHWSELEAGDRQQVLKVAAPLLSDPRHFEALHSPLFDLTRDFSYLRRNAPQTAGALRALSSLAVTNGLFAEYRSLRKEQRVERWKSFQQVRDSAQPAELLEFLPEHLDAQDMELARAILEELDRKPFAGQISSRRAEDLALFALRHKLQPLSALAPLIEVPGSLSEPTRARVAVALGNPALASKIELTSSTTQSPAWLPYHLDRAVFEARSGDRSVAEAYLLRTISHGIDDRILTSAEEVARLKGDLESATRYHRELLAAAKKPRVWLETCGTNELCARAITRQYVADAKDAIRVTLSRLAPPGAEADPVPPYVEMYVDGTLVQEGPVGGQTVLEAKTTVGLHRIELRLVNRMTRNGIQRRVRLS